MDVQTIFKYPDDVVSTLTGGMDGPSRAQRLSRNLQRGVIATEDYAGIGSASMAFTQGCLAAQECGLVPLGCTPFCCWRACDVDETCLQVLGKKRSIIVDPSERPLHVFADLNNRLPTDVLEMLNELQPSKTAGKEEKARAYQQMKNIIQDNKADIFHPDCTGHCEVHGNQCLLMPPKFLSVESIMKAKANSCTSGDVVGEVHLPETERPWLTNHAGHACTAWSCRGKQEGSDHETQRPFSIWTAERTQLSEDVVFGECTVRFPPNELEKAIPGRQLLSFYVGPEQLGWPVRRPRVLNALLNPDTTIWCGPDSYADDFASLFHRVCTVDGNLLCLSSQAERQEYMQRQAGRRGLYLTEEVSRIVDMRKLLTPASARRYSQYKALWEESGHAAFFAELDQEYDSGHGRSCGPIIPTMLTSGEIVNFASNSLLTPKERLAANGLPVFEETHVKYKAKGGAPFVVPFDITMLTSSDIRRLAGNAQHLHVLLAWFFYVMANIERRESLEPLCRGPQVSGARSGVGGDPDSSDPEEDLSQPAKRARATPFCDRAETAETQEGEDSWQDSWLDDLQ